MPMTSLEMIKYLKKHGFKKISQNGSHVKMKNEKTGRPSNVVSIPHRYVLNDLTDREIAEARAFQFLIGTF